LELFDTQAIDQISVCHYSRAHHAVVCYRRFPEGVRKAADWRGSVRRFVLRDGIVTVGRSFLRIFLWPRNPVSRKRRPREAETRFECRLRRRKSEHLVLARPVGGHVGEAGHSHAMRQPPRDGRFHEIGRQEGKRDRHVDLPNAAPLALGNAFRICVRVGKKFVEPMAASRNRCDQERAGLRAYLTSVLRWNPRGQKDLPAPR
jgi:hypothetical protein